MLLKVKSIEKKGKSKLDFKDLHFEVGILDKKINFIPKYKEFKQVAGKKTRKINRKTKNKWDNVEVLQSLEKRYRLLSKPKTKNIERLKIQSLQGVIDFLFSGKGLNGALNAVRAIIRQPILEGRYKNSEATIKAKGFNRGGMDTAQTYNQIEPVLIKDNKEYRLK